MDPNLTTIRLELGINAQRVLSEFRTHNHTLEESVARGIEAALEEITADGNFENMIKEKTKEEIGKMVNKAVFSWEMRSKIEKAVAEKIDAKIHAYADKIADQITSALK